jgi:hypothetical protein
VVPLVDLSTRTLHATHRDLLAVSRQSTLELIDATSGAMKAQLVLPGRPVSTGLFGDGALQFLVQACTAPPCQSFSQLSYQLVSVDPVSLRQTVGMLPSLSSLPSPQ